MSFDPAAILSSYGAAFQARMQVDPKRLAKRVEVLQIARELPEPLRDTLDTLLLAHPEAGHIDLRFRALLEEGPGAELWLYGLVLPRGLPKGARGVDPTNFAGAARLHPALKRRRPLRERLREDVLAEDLSPTHPPSDARFDAVVVAVAIEANPPRLKQDLGLRKDTLQRLMRSLGDDPDRWSLALSLAMASGLCRPAGGRLRGYPESKARSLDDPAALLPEDLQTAGRLLLRLVGQDWISLDTLLSTLRTRCRQVLHSPNEQGAYDTRPGTHFDEQGFDHIELPLFKAAATALYRARQLDGRAGSEGVEALRQPQPGPEYPPGFLLTPDLEILVAPEELPAHIYGRLARLAPFVEGTRVHRHRITSDGVARDLTAGHSDPAEFLARYSRTGVPPTVAQSLAAWSQSAERISLLSGVDILEQDGRFTVVESPPEHARELQYGLRDAPVPASFQAEGADHLLVPTEHEALTVRAALERVAVLERWDDAGLHYRLRPTAAEEPEALLDSLRSFHDGPLPGQLEVSVLAASQPHPAPRQEEAVVLHLPESLSPALVRDPVAGPLLGRVVAPGQHLVDREHLPELLARLERLGLSTKAP
ncbi:MAG: hypothetical protein VX899_26520 [Myxococcota bacterium]|nr:hypothetical protein [Myxococcota bacterium]